MGPPAGVDRPALSHGGQGPPARRPGADAPDLLPGRGGRRQVSADGGDQARWSRNSREIVYRKGDAVFAASFNPATGEVGAPTLLFRKADASRLFGGRTIGYDVTPDGSQFLMVTPVERVGSQPVVVVLHWLDELRAKVPR